MSKTMECPRCGGEGVISQYGHISAGVCFRCGGSRVVPYRKPTAPKAAKVTAWTAVVDALAARYPNAAGAEWAAFDDEFGFLPAHTPEGWAAAIAQCF